jgi:hypothetical protein
MEKIDLTAYLKETVVVDHHKFRDMPYIDKSRWRAHKKCGFMFQLRVTEQMQGKSVTDELTLDHSARDTGTNSHLVIAYFFKAIIDNDLLERFMKLPIDDTFKGSLLYYTFFDICNQILPEKLRSDQFQQRIISNFCEYQKDYWNYLSRELGHTKAMFKKFFIPIYIELYIENFDMMLFGTMDAMYNNPLHGTDTKWGKKKYTIIDYKTGYVSTMVTRGRKMPDGSYKPDFTSEDRQELHFYAWLVTHAQVKREIVNATTMEKEIVNVPLFPDLKEYTDVIANMIFLGEDRPIYLPPMTMNEKSMNTVFKDITIMRETWVNGGNYPRVDDSQIDYVCKSCDYVEYCNGLRLKEAMGQ